MMSNLFKDDIISEMILVFVNAKITNIDLRQDEHSTSKITFIFSSNQLFDIKQKDLLLKLFENDVDIIIKEKIDK